MTTSDDPTQRLTRPPLRLALTILHLAALGLVGWALVGTLLGILGAGIALVFVLGIGLVVLAGLVYALFGIAWFETARVSGLYGLDVPPLRLRPVEQPGFGGYLRTLGRQAVDGRVWASVANFATASTLGVVVLGMVQAFIWSVGGIIAAATDREYVTAAFFTDVIPVSALALGIAGAVLFPAVIVLLALAHRAISCGIIGWQARAATLTAHARASDEQREGAVRAADLERTRIERDLHDGVQPRLVSVGMTLGLAQQEIDRDPAAAKALIGEAHTSTKAAITELRQLARGIHASVLDDRGLDAALSALAGRSHIPIQLDVRLDRRCGRDAEAAVYFVIAEALTNAAKHSRASECRVVVRLREVAPTDASGTAQHGALWARVEDNGIGGATPLPGGGLEGISNRVLAAGGTIRIDSPQGGPTAVEVSVPCAS
ncbi:hypothetical protein FCK90_12415 [Kocuria coralli]|uniref:histidine kinase n=1 Tax=Kocuria coralli TaxID=1461025 RepID=A0A5J5KV81_9MICC|nr:histidine kinase [Kocuria coralli]KAA9393442.1 hypothetical protein FCK90_12415 [Kocuria coralli]